jgi:hypothetical protein
MPLIDLSLPTGTAGVPGDVRSFLREADRRIRRFQRRCRVPGFVPTDFESAYGVLRAVATAGLTRGNLFCEWGSGFGVVACLATMLDFDACGIEVEAELVEAARRLAGDFGLPVEFAHGSFIPQGGEARARAVDEFAWLTTDADDAHDELGLAADDFDVIFAYPWPDEEGLTADLFERHAAAGALLLTYHGGEDFRLRRKRITRFRTRARRPSGVKPTR